MKKYLIILILFVWAIFPTNVKADVGPKPIIEISVEDLEDERCYATLLSAQAVSGPYQAYDLYGQRNIAQEIDPDIFAAFAGYDDADGYHFMQIVWDLSQEPKISWTYYPPKNFKVLLYYPQSDTYQISDSYQTYAFDSTYVLKQEEEKLILHEAYDYQWELISLGCRVLLTIVIEMLVALAFGLWKKEALPYIIKINIITQILLNAVLNIVNYYGGSLLFMLAFVPFEVLVCAIEMIYYNKVKTKMAVSRKRILVYAFCANVVSMIGGWYLAWWIPGIF